MKKFKIPLFMLAFCIALAASFAFNLPEKGGKQFSQYHYTSTDTDFDVMRNPANWQGSGSSGCNEFSGTIPCVIEYAGEDLGGYLTNLGSSAAIVNEALTKRTP